MTSTFSMPSGSVRLSIVPRRSVTRSPKPLAATMMRASACGGGAWRKAGAWVVGRQRQRVRDLARRGFEESWAGLCMCMCMCMHIKRLQEAGRVSRVESSRVKSSRVKPCRIERRVEPSRAESRPVESSMRVVESRVVARFKSSQAKSRCVESSCVESRVGSSQVQAESSLVKPSRVQSGHMHVRAPHLWPRLLHR